MGLFGYGDPYQPADLNQFWAKHAPFIPKGTKPKVKSINGAVAEGEPVEGEELLDIEMSYPIVYPQTVTSSRPPIATKEVLQMTFSTLLTQATASMMEVMILILIPHSLSLVASKALLCAASTRLQTSFQSLSRLMSKLYLVVTSSASVTSG